jgi:hypothetical protein
MREGDDNPMRRRRLTVIAALVGLVIVSCILVLGHGHQPSLAGRNSSAHSARRSLAPLPAPVSSYLPAGSVQLQKSKIAGAGGSTGWVIFYKLPGKPLPSKRYPFRWLSIAVFYNPELPSFAASGPGPQIVESRHQATISGHRGVLYTATSPDGVIMLEWLSKGAVLQVQTCAGCKVTLAALRDVATHVSA